MDTLRKIERLFQEAAREPAPVFRVSRKVMGRLAGGEPESYLAFDVFAAVSAVAASALLFWAISAWLTMSDPMNVLVEPVVEVALW